MDSSTRGDQHIAWSKAVAKGSKPATWLVWICEVGTRKLLVNIKKKFLCNNFNERLLDSNDIIFCVLNGWMDKSDDAIRDDGYK